MLIRVDYKSQLIEKKYNFAVANARLDLQGCSLI